MTGWPLTIALLWVFAAGICMGAAFASFIYARRYRALRLDIWGERMAGEAEASRPAYLSELDELAFRKRLGGRSRKVAERFIP
ncbi:hypothetical protein ACKU27_01065 [Sphingobium yanoikuyae]|jgi:hypothetical protein